MQINYIARLMYAMHARNTDAIGIILLQRGDGMESRKEHLFSNLREYFELHVFSAKTFSTFHKNSSEISFLSESLASFDEQTRRSNEVSFLPFFIT